MIFTDVAYKANNGLTSFGFCYDVKWNYGGCRCNPSSKSCLFKRGGSKAKEKAKPNDFDRVCILMDAKEMVQAFKGGHNWSINPIISDIKVLAALFCCIEFD